MLRLVAVLVTAIALAVLASSFTCLELQASSSYVQPAIETSTSGFKRVVFYYGWLNTARNLLNINFDTLVFAGSVSNLSTWLSILEELHSKGVELYVYLHDENGNPVGLGETFDEMVVKNSTGTLDQRVAYWMSFIEKLIASYASWSKSHGDVLTGVFLDECDPSYFGYTDPSNVYVQKFSQALEQIVSYAHSLGLKVFINGVRAYASLGDYYLWEDFVATYDPNTKSYGIDTSFFTTSSSNPYDWVNGIAKYEYLKQNNLLGKTIALSYADRNHLRNAIVAYYAARILGLAGWAFAPGDTYASGGNVTTINVYEVGQALTPPSLDPSSSTMSRVFIVGKIVVNIASASVELPFEYNPKVVLDGSLDPCYTTFTEASQGSYSRIILYGYVATPWHLYIYVESSWSQVPSSDGILHIYVDSDGDKSTGFQVYGIGADYLVEVYADGTARLFAYSGSGTSWSWEFLSVVPLKFVASGNDVRIELSLPSSIYSLGKTRIVIATVYSWNDDSITSAFTISKQYVSTPTIYDSYAEYQSYYPIITSVSMSTNKAVIELLVPSGKSFYVNCTIVTKLREVAKVLKNGVELKHYSTPNFAGEGWYSRKLGNGLTIVTVVVDPSTPVTITILGPSAIAMSSGGSGGILGGYATSLARHVLLALAIAVGVSIFVLIASRKHGGNSVSII